MLDAIKEHLNMKKNTELANYLGISSQAVSNWYSRNTFDAELLYTKCEFLNPGWLLTGEGPMLKEENKHFLEIASSNEEIASIPMVDISVAAGCTGYDNPDYIEIVDSITMPASMIKHNAQYFCVRVKGESMAPTILDSSYVIVRLIERQDWADLSEQHVYVVSDREGRAYLKRLKNRLREHGFITCMSDNPDKANYPNFNLQQDEINTILHAEWYFSAKMPNIHDTYYKKVSELEDKYDVLENQMQQIFRSIKIIK